MKLEAKQRVCCSCEEYSKGAHQNYQPQGKQSLYGQLLLSILGVQPGDYGCFLTFVLDLRMTSGFWVLS
jgi:hypothetical protein